MSLLGILRSTIYNKSFNPVHALNYETCKASFPSRFVSTGKFLLNEESVEEKVDEKSKVLDPAKDRSKIIPVETSIQYMKSTAYSTTYQQNPVWKQYRRNHKGQTAPKKTRKTCIRFNQISTGNPCPICRDEYLVLHPKNIDLIKQFISPHTGAVYSYSLTGICQKRHNELLVAVQQAKDMGLISFDIPFREYDYSEYMTN